MHKPLSFKRHRFPADVIRQAAFLYFRFTLSLRDVEELMAQRGVEVSYETIRRWIARSGRQIAVNLRRRRSAPAALAFSSALITGCVPNPGEGRLSSCRLTRWR